MWEATCSVEAVRMCCSFASGPEEERGGRGTGCCAPNLHSHPPGGNLWPGTQNRRRNGEICSSPKGRESDFMISSKTTPSLSKNCVSRIRLSLKLLILWNALDSARSLPYTTQAGSLSQCTGNKPRRMTAELAKIATLSLCGTRSLSHHRPLWSKAGATEGDAQGL